VGVAYSKQGKRVLSTGASRQYEDAEWLATSIAEHGVRGTARICGCDHTTILRAQNRLLRAKPEESPEDTMARDAERLRAQHAARVRKVYTEEAVRTHILVEAVRECVTALPAVKVCPPLFTGRATRTPMTQVTQCADWHFGEKVDPEQVMGLNAYDPEIAARRVFQFEKHVLTGLDIIGRAHPIPRLRILFLGDMVSGAIHQELAESNAFNLYEQWAGVCLLMAQFILRLAPHYEEVVVEGVPGNHGRTTQKPASKNRYVNWDYLAYQTVSLMVANQPNVRCNFPSSIFTLTDIEGHSTLLYHGDAIKSWAGIPFYGVSRMMAKLTELLQSVGKTFEYAALGHFHTDADMPRAGGKVMLTPSLIGGNEYSIGTLFTSDQSSQGMYFMHPEHGRTWQLDSDLSHGDTIEHPYVLSAGASLGATVREVVA
jgi:hypothetical protein